MVAYKPRAYAQGELDYLCGLYAVINAVRHTIGPVRRFGGSECLWLFDELVGELARRRLLAPTMMMGMNQRHVGVLLRTSQAVIASQFGFSFSVRKPFHRRSQVSRRHIMATIRQHQNAGAVLIGLGMHWSVVEAVTPAGLRLLDSFKYRHVHFRRLIVGRPRHPDQEERDWILPSSLHLLQYRNR